VLVHRTPREAKAVYLGDGCEKLIKVCHLLKVFELRRSESGWFPVGTSPLTPTLSSTISETLSGKHLEVTTSTVWGYMMSLVT